MSIRLLLDEHYADKVAERLVALGHEVVAAVDDLDLRSSPDDELFRWAAAHDRRIVTENVKDFRPLLLDALAAGTPVARLLLVSPRRLPRGGSDRAAAIVAALDAWLAQPDLDRRSDEDWLV